MKHISIPGNTPPDRFLFIDGLRGVAAMMVVFFHMKLILSDAVGRWFPPWLDTLFGHGDLGVDVFFVLSGFVIAHSIRDGDHTFQYLGKYALRRSIRLDPPLWAAILLEIVLIQVSLYFYPDLGTKTPTLKQVLVNIAYLQEMLHVGNVIAVLWSLTYEVQFYFISVSFLVAVRLIRRWDVQIPWSKVFAYSLMVLAYTYSIAIYQNLVPTPLRGIFLERWFQFFLGVMAWAVLRHKLPQWVFVMAWTVCLVSTLVLAPSGYRTQSSLCALLISALILWVGSSGRMDRLLSGNVSQFLGKISYSLYLLHLPIGWRFGSLMKRLAGNELSVIIGTTVFVGSVAASVFAAWLMHRILEAPSMNIARKVRLPKRSDKLPSSNDLLQLSGSHLNL